MTQDDKIKELLAVPDMPEEEQLAFLDAYDDETIDGQKILIASEWHLPKRALSDLAFRLRDEVKEHHNSWCSAKTMVWRYKNEDAKRLEKIVNKYQLDEGNRVIQRREVFFTNQAKPIHFIIAALIAKVLNET